MFDYVHHILIFLCHDPIDEQELGDSGPCFDGSVGRTVATCTGSELIGAWAVGGQVSITYRAGAIGAAGAAMAAPLFCVRMIKTNCCLLSVLAMLERTRA